MAFKVLLKNKYPEMTKSQKKIAEFLINDMENAVFMTAMQIGKQLDTSETSVIRFAHSLGYENFSSMHDEMRACFLKESRCSNDSGFKAYDYIEPINDFLKNNVLGIRPEYSLIDFDEFSEIADLIMKSKKVLIIGYMDSFGISSELLHMLDMRRKKVYFYRLLFEERNILYDMDQDSLLITVSLSPHYRYSHEHTKTAKEGGCKIISITDDIINPYNDLSDYSIVFNLDKNSSDGLKDTSIIAKFTYYLGLYLNHNYGNEIESYRKSSDWRVEQFLD